MIHWIDLINLITVVCGLTIALMGLLFSVSVPYLNKKDRVYLSLLFVLIILYSLSDLASQLSLTYFRPGSLMVSKCSVFLESFFSSVCMPVLTLYILSTAGRNEKKDPFAAGSFLIWILYFILLCYTQVSYTIYYLTPDNTYHRGAYYPILLIPPVLLMIWNLFCLYWNREDLSKRQLAAFLVYLLVPLFCMAVQMVWYGILMIIIGTSLGSAYMLYSIIKDQLDHSVKQAQEIASQKVNIMMLEMRPHFIYNTLTSIYYLCEQDVKKAQQVTLDFSVYLRKNFTAISKENTIPFSEELEHTKAYLAVETARYEGSLFVDYDFGNMPLFRIPPLTLQPVVENAIKHGLDPELEPLHINISVRDSSAGYTVTVEDNGVGFDNTENDEPHIALRNIRERLKLMCNGTLTIDPRPSELGGGTKVTIFIPASSGK